MTEYDSDEPPTTLEEAMDRLKQSIVWEFLESGMYQEMPCSTYINWNDAAQRRYIKAAENLKRFFTQHTSSNYGVSGMFRIEEKSDNLNDESINKVVKTLREYLRG